MGKAYAASVIERLQGGVWGEIVFAESVCEGLTPQTCSSQPRCQLRSQGSCRVAFMWLAEKLTTPRWLGGAGLGVERCGLLGQLLAGKALCGNSSSSSECSARNSSSAGQVCAWDMSRNVCDVPEAWALALLRQDYREQLQFIALRRQRCSSLSQELCIGSCRWQPSPLANATVPGRCTLRRLETLLAVVDEDCPLRPLIELGGSCSEYSNATACTSNLRKDELQTCFWTNKTCEANPVALEFDLLLLLGLTNPNLKQTLLAAQRQCSKKSADKCSVSDACAKLP